MPQGEAAVAVRTACVPVLVAVLGLVGCTAGPVAGGAAESSQAAASPSPVAAPSGPATAHLLVQGTVRGVAGAAPATVSVTVWPHDDHTAVGQVVDTWQSPPVTADASGHWSLEVDPGSLAPKYLSTDQPFVNFDVNVRSGNLGTQWSTSAWTTGEGGVWRSEGAAEKDRVIDVAMDLVDGRVTVADSLGEGTTSPLTLGTVAPTSG